ncbi:uncharacterized protein LOC106379018 [Brassica napus]|uniref:uncharacterized protein LOC106379018 n=1 Tax=Brassica napus TaxID=3708 RepID=UPI0006AA7D9B|nr:uncharacterized protein LOC106379018 [Brassica napus]
MGGKASFWHEVWSPLGCLRDILGNGAHIDLGIPVNANVDASRSHRRRHHRLPILNRVELEIENYKAKWKDEEDISMWKNEKGSYKKKFTTKAMHERLSTCDRMKSWNINIDETCVLCKGSAETMRHLFFECPYSRQVWEGLMKGVMQDQFSAEWERIVWIASDGLGEREIRIWREEWPHGLMRGEKVVMSCSGLVGVSARHPVGVSAGKSVGVRAGYLVGVKAR